MIKNGNYIINLADSDDAGTHWTGLYVNNKKQGFYFDSFGGPPPSTIIKQCKDKKIKLAMNRFIVQDLKSTNCGLYVIAFLHYMNTHSDIFKDADTFIDQFVEDTKSNDIVLSLYFAENGSNHKLLKNLIKKYRNKKIEYY